MDVVCPHCGTQVTADPSAAGAEAHCSSCGGRFAVPVPAARPAGLQGGAARDDRPADYAQFVSKKVAAGICGILLGGLGVHKFLLGFNTAGVIMLALSLSGWITGVCLIVPLIAPAVVGVIGLAEGIIYLTKSDEDFYQTYAVKKKEWF